jgi:ion channel-forming bestrophin family protein
MIKINFSQTISKKNNKFALQNTITLKHFIMIPYDNKAWYKHIFVWKGSVVKGIFPRVLFFMLWTALITWLYWEGYIPKEKKIDMVVYNVIGLALGLLLVFRTNTSYDRYWEGRKLLGATVNSCRTLARLFCSLIPAEDKKTRSEIAELLSSFNFAVKERLRDGVKPEHLPMLRKEYLDEAFKFDHVPNGIMKLLNAKIQEAIIKYKASDSMQLSISNELTTITNNMGGMERIRFTPVPFAYAAHLQLFIMIYFIFLPFGLYAQLQWLAVPAIGIISLILLGINEIGVEIEDPFGDDPNDLPVDTICENIQKNVTEILD